MEQHGLGIGLFLVKGLAQMHDGSITAESGGPGKGSRFTVSLPVAAAPAQSARSAPAGSKPASAKQVLVVDDNADAAETLSQLLELVGHVARTAKDGASALASFDACRPDVVLLDIGLPDLDGYEVARRIRSRAGNTVKLVALTGWGQAEDKRRAADAGFDSHWTKPVDPAKLQEI
jgi:CheY-like chemotaxis protein